MIIIKINSFNFNENIEIVGDIYIKELKTFTPNNFTIFKTINNNNNNFIEINFVQLITTKDIIFKNPLKENINHIALDIKDSLGDFLVLDGLKKIVSFEGYKRIYLNVNFSILLMTESSPLLKVDNINLKIYIPKTANLMKSDNFKNAIFSRLNWIFEKTILLAKKYFGKKLNNLNSIIFIISLTKFFEFFKTFKNSSIIFIHFNELPTPEIDLLNYKEFSNDIITKIIFIFLAREESFLFNQSLLLNYCETLALFFEKEIFDDFEEIINRILLDFYNKRKHMKYFFIFLVGIISNICISKKHRFHKGPLSETVLDIIIIIINNVENFNLVEILKKINCYFGVDIEYLKFSTNCYITNGYPEFEIITNIIGLDHMEICKTSIKQTGIKWFDGRLSSIIMEKSGIVESFYQIDSFSIGKYYYCCRYRRNKKQKGRETRKTEDKGPTLKWITYNSTGMIPCIIKLSIEGSDNPFEILNDHKSSYWMKALHICSMNGNTDSDIRKLIPFLNRNLIGDNGIFKLDKKNNTINNNEKYLIPLFLGMLFNSKFIGNKLEFKLTKKTAFDFNLYVLPSKLNLAIGILKKIIVLLKEVEIISDLEIYINGFNEIMKVLSFNVEEFEKVNKFFEDTTDFFLNYIIPKNDSFKNKLFIGIINQLFYGLIRGIFNFYINDNIPKYVMLKIIEIFKKLSIFWRDYDFIIMKSIIHEKNNFKLTKILKFNCNL